MPAAGSPRVRSARFAPAQDATFERALDTRSDKARRVVRLVLRMLDAMQGDLQELDR